MRPLKRPLRALRRWYLGHEDGARFTMALLLALLGALLAAAAAIADLYLHRGIETGAEQPYVVHPTGRELATNVDLTLFPVNDVAGIAQVLQASGFRYVRQSVAWSEVEPEPGRFVWDRYDAAIDALTTNRIEPVLVLHRSPDWARDESDRGLPDAPPLDVGDYAAFVGEVVRRYGDRVRFVQIWDLPNRADHWGGEPATPGAYVSLLAQGSNAAREADPGVRVILAELDPRPESGIVGDDLALLRDIYRAGGQPFFDVAAVQIDGGTFAPEDRWVADDRLNLSRAILYRDVMIEADDRATPLWATRYGWPAGEGAGGVSREEQAEFVVEGLDRAATEWPWMGLMFAWSFVRANDGDARFAMVNDDGTATPLLSSLVARAERGDADVAAAGFTPMDSVPVSYRGSWADQHLDDRTLRTTSEVGASATLRFEGTEVVAYLRRGPRAGDIRATVDGEPLPGWPEVDGASVISLYSFQAVDLPMRLATGLDDGTHELTLTLAEPGELTVGGLIVVRELPFMWPVLVLTVVSALALFWAFREMIYVIALRSGHLQRRRGVDLWPQLPQLPEWRPSRRA